MTRDRYSWGLIFAMALPAVWTGCSKKPEPVEEPKPEAAAPAPTPEVTELAPLVDDAGFDAGVDTKIVKKATGGGGGNANQLKVKQCCNAMRAEAKQLGSSPEANQITAFAMQCDMIAAQVGPQGNAPEFNQLRAVLKSIKLPAACQF
jgi:hypothetical protein